MMLVFVRAVFHQAVRETHQPSAIVARLASALYAETRGDSYLTCVVIHVDEVARRLTSANAGHPSPFITGSTPTHLTRGGPPAGLLPNTAYEEETTELAAGSRLVFLTDGLTERMPDGIEAVIAGLDDKGSADDLCASILAWSEGPDAASPTAGWDDDRTVLVVAVD